MSTGLPVLAVIDHDSELSQTLCSEQIGVSVEASEGDIEQGVRDMIKAIKNDKFSRARISEYAQEHFSKTVILTKLRNTILDYG